LVFEVDWDRIDVENRTIDLLVLLFTLCLDYGNIRTILRSICCADQLFISVDVPVFIMGIGYKESRVS